MLYIIRGVPGTGKSTLAKMIVASTGADHYEADMFFINESGEYEFKPVNLPRAHEWCFNQAVKAMDEGRDVIVSNTFTRHWEYQRYTKEAKKRGVPVNIIVCKTIFGNVHGVTEETIHKMLDRWED